MPPAARSCLMVSLAGAVVALWLAPTAGAEQLRVVVVPGLELADLDRVKGRGSVGLLVPDAGPRTSEPRALASLESGEVVNSLRGELPRGAPLIEVETAERIPPGAVIVLGLPRGGEQPNDRRYPIAVLRSGIRGLLVSRSTRIPGLVSVVDVAPTALGKDGALRGRSAADPVDELRELDRRIADNGDSRLPASVVAAALIVALALAFPPAAALGFATGLGANLLLGIAGVSDPWLAIPAIGLGVLAAAPLARVLGSPTRVGLSFAAVLVAYLAALGIDEAWVALSPLGPTQNSRFYGISNLVETMLLVPALAGAVLLGRRYGPLAVAAVAAVALVAVAGSRFGADGGGAIVLAAGFAALALGLSGGGRRSLFIATAGGAAAVGLLALDAALGPSTHVGETIRGGPDELAGDLIDRLELSWERATSGWAIGLTVVVALAALTWRVTHARRAQGAARALLVAFATAIAVSMVVNDSPGDVAVAGLVGYLALERLPAAGADNV